MAGESFILINAFEVPVGAEEEFIHGCEATRDYLQTQPGYVKTALHLLHRLGLQERCANPL